MPTQRQRLPSTTSQWPQLSLLAIYTATPILEPSSSDEQDEEKLSDQQLEAAKVIYFYSANEQDAIDPERKRKAMSSVMGVADFAKMMTLSGGDDRIRSVKTSKRRMVWIEPEDGIFVHLTMSLPRASKRHSRQVSAATTSTSRSANTDASTLPLDDQILISSLSLAYDTYRLTRRSVKWRLEEEGKQETMKSLDEFWNEWIRTWDLQNFAEGQSAMMQVLRGLPMSPLLTSSTSSQIDPLLAQFTASNPTYVPILLNRTDILHLPTVTESTFLTERDLPTLTKYLLSIARLRIASLASTTTEVSSVSDPLSMTATQATIPSSSTNWTSSALSYFDPRNIPLPSLSTLNNTLSPLTSTNSTDLRRDFEGLRNESRKRRDSNSSNNSSHARRHSNRLQGKKEGNVSGIGEVEKSKKESAGGGGGSGTWGLRSVSRGWSKLGAAFGATKSGDVPSSLVVAVEGTGKDTAPTANDSPTGYPPPASSSPPKFPALVPPMSIETEPAEDPTYTHITTTSPSTPAVELAPEVNEEDLREAMASVEVNVDSTGPKNDAATSIDAVGNGEVTTEEAEEKNEAKVLKLFSSVDDEPFEVRLFERGVLVLALASRPIVEASPSINLDVLESRSNRLLEAIEAVLDSVAKPQATSTSPPSLVKSDKFLYSTFSSSSTPTPSTAEISRESDLEVNTAFFDANRALNSSLPILESLTRLPTSSNWFSLSQSTHVLPPTKPQFRTEDVDNETEEKRIEVIAVLPSKNSRGKETSLVEAAEGARRIEKRWVAQRAGV